MEFTQEVAYTLPQNRFYQLAKSIQCVQNQAILFMRQHPQLSNTFLIITSDFGIFKVTFENQDILNRGSFTGHKDRINEATFMETSKPEFQQLFASGDDAGVLILWDSESSTIIYQIDTFFQEKDKYRGVFSILLNDNYLLAGCHRDLNVYSVETGKLQMSSNFAHAEEVSALCFSPDKTKLVTGSSEGILSVFDLRLDIGELDSLEYQIYIEQTPNAIGFVADNLIYVFTGIETFEIFSTDSCLRVFSFNAVQPEIGLQYLVSTKSIAVSEECVKLVGGNFDGFMIILTINVITGNFEITDAVKTDIPQGLNSYFLIDNSILVATDAGILSLLTPIK